MYTDVQRQHKAIQEKDLLLFFLNLSRVCGDVVAYGKGIQPAYLINHPDYAEQVLATNEANYLSPPHPYKVLLPLLSDSGAFMLRLLARGRNGRFAFDSICERVVTHTAVLLEDWQAGAGKISEVTVPIKTMMLQLVTNLLFEVESPTNPVAYVEATNFIERCIANQSFFDADISLPIGERRRYKEAQAVHRLYADAILAQKRADGDEHLLAWLAQVGEAHLLFAVTRTLLNSYNALAGALAWSLHLLSQHPDVFAILRQEITDVLGEQQASSQHIPHLTYTRMVVLETMRLYPPAWMLGREAAEVDQIGEVVISSKTAVSVCPYTMHRLAAQWQEPTTFQPERFRAEMMKKRHPYAYLPFGGGTRICPAAHISVQILQLMLAMIGQRFRPQPVPDFPVTPHGLISLRPYPHLMMRLVPLSLSNDRTV